MFSKALLHYNFACLYSFFESLRALIRRCFTHFDKGQITLSFFYEEMLIAILLRHLKVLRGF
jgi:small basic protein